MEILVLVVAAYLPAVALLWFFGRMDRYEREPTRLLINLFLLGLGASVPVLALSGIISELFTIPPVGTSSQPAAPIASSFTIAAIVAFVLAAIIQEASKLLFALSRVRHDPSYSEPVDGMVYMTAVALGFAAALSAEQVIQAFALLGPDVEGIDVGGGLATVIIRAPIVALAQVAFSGIVGYYLSRYILGRQSITILALGLGIGILFNVIFAIAFAAGTALSEDLLVGLIPALVVLAAELAVYVYLFRRSMHISPYRPGAATPVAVEG